jgi:hypothetical protein
MPFSYGQTPGKRRTQTFLQRSMTSRAEPNVPSRLAVELLWQLLTICLGLLFVGASACAAQGYLPFLALAGMPAGWGAAAFASWHRARRFSSHPYAWAWIVGALTAIGGVAAGRACFDALMSAEIRRVEGALAREVTEPGQFEVPGNRLLRRTLLWGKANSNSRVTFGLSDGTVVVREPDPAHWPRAAQQPCSQVIQPGWFRRWRCAGQ